jgi:hypothetical protein
MNVIMVQAALQSAAMSKITAYWQIFCFCSKAVGKILVDLLIISC